MNFLLVSVFPFVVVLVAVVVRVGGVEVDEVESFLLVSVFLLVVVSVGWWRGMAGRRWTSADGAGVTHTPHPSP